MLEAGINVISTLNIQHLGLSTTSTRRSPRRQRENAPTRSSAEPSSVSWSSSRRIALRSRLGGVMSIRPSASTGPCTTFARATHGMRDSRSRGRRAERRGPGRELPQTRSSNDGRREERGSSRCGLSRRRPAGAAGRAQSQRMKAELVTVHVIPQDETGRVDRRAARGTREAVDERGGTYQGHRRRPGEDLVTPRTPSMRLTT